MNKGAFVNKLDYVILASLEVDTHFNCNVVARFRWHHHRRTGRPSRYRTGCKVHHRHRSSAAGPPSRPSAPTSPPSPHRARASTSSSLTTAWPLTPRRPDLLEALKAADCVPLKTIEELRDIAYSIVGEPEKVQFGDRIVGIIEARDGTVMDVVREVKPFSFRED